MPAVRTAVRKAFLGTRRRVRERSAEARMLPQFLIIGAQRAGTTSLYRYLSSHPDIQPPLIKEIQYFSLYHHRGPAWYRAHFPLLVEGKTSFEASPYYLFHPLAPGRASALLPEAKLVVLLRDPVQRAFSHYRHNVRLGHEDLDFARAVETEGDRILASQGSLLREGRPAPPGHRLYSYVARGEYADQLARWLAAYPPEQLLALFSEELFARPGPTLERVQAFLGLPAHRLEQYEVFTRSGPGGELPAGELRRRLQSHFVEHNRRLERLLGCPVPWGY